MASYESRRRRRRRRRRLGGANHQVALRRRDREWRRMPQKVTSQLDVYSLVHSEKPSTTTLCNEKFNDAAVHELLVDDVLHYPELLEQPNDALFGQWAH
jgi:hypothetical protein